MRVPMCRRHESVSVSNQKETLKKASFDTGGVCSPKTDSSRPLWLVGTQKQLAERAELSTRQQGRLS